MKPTQPTAMPWTPALPEEGLAASAAPARAGSWWHHVATATPASPMPADHRQRFLQLALDAAALRFGEFTLKSGRSSPYFFNAGHFDSGVALAGLAACYADAIDAAAIEFDLLFGPAYKGIPLATALACEYARRGRDLPVAFNRKEAKDHGEGRSEEHTSELQSLMRISYAVFCLKKK